MSTNQELPAVARNVNMPCKKCGVDRYFVVVAHTSATSAKTKCEVCGATKTYKLESAKKAATGAAKKSKAAKAAEAHAANSAAFWNELKDKIGTSQVHRYEMGKTFKTAMAIEHPKFGLGFVTNAFSDKIEVAFQEGGRFLVHNRG